MKKEELKKVLREKKNWFLGGGIVLILLILLITGCILLSGKEKETGRQDMAGFLAERMMDSGLSGLVEDEKQLQEMTGAVTQVLEKLAGSGADRAGMVEAVKEVVRNMNPELSNEEVTELAEWLVSQYLESYSTYHEGEVYTADLSQAGEAALGQMKEDLSGIYDYLAQLDESVSVSREELLNINLSQSDSYEEVRKHLDQINSDVEGLKNNGEIAGGIEELLLKLSSVHEEINATQKEIQGTLQLISDSDATVSENILGNIASVNEALSRVQSDVNNTHEKLQAMINSFQDSENGHYGDLLTVLNDMDSSFTSQNTKNFTSMVDSLKQQSDTMQQQFEALGSRVNDSKEATLQSIADSKNSTLQSITDTRDSTLQSITDSKNSTLQSIADSQNSTLKSISESKAATIESMTALMDQNYEKLTSHLSGMGNESTSNKDEILQKINELETSTETGFNQIGSDLNAVFQSVSNGKKLLAAALLTKNVTVAENATFGELQNAILNIPQQIVIGVEQVPGEIEYEYHYHTGDPVNGGGCYTERLYHQHTAACYTKAVCQPFCTGLSAGYKNDDWIYHYDTAFIHPSCGRGTVYSSPRHRDGEACHCDAVSSHTYDKLTCGMTNATPVGWGVGCGFVDGQIIGARITYNTAAQQQKTREALSLIRSVEYVPQIYDDYGPAVIEDGENQSEKESPEGTGQQPETGEAETEMPETEGTEAGSSGTGKPEAVVPGSGEAATEAPETETPETEAPETETPGTEESGTEASGTGEAGTEAQEPEAAEAGVPETGTQETRAPEPGGQKNSQPPETEALP